MKDSKNGAVNPVSLAFIKKSDLRKEIGRLPVPKNYTNQWDENWKQREEQNEKNLRNGVYSPRKIRTKE